MSIYHGWKGETIYLIPHYLIDIIHKTIKPSHLEKLKIKQNLNKLIIQAIFIFSEWTLIKQIKAFPTTFVLGETDFQISLPVVLSRGLGHDFQCIESMHFLGEWTPEIENIFPHVVYYTS